MARRSRTAGSQRLCSRYGLAGRNAIANWEIAIRNIPANQKVNLPVYEQALKALKEKG